MARKGSSLRDSLLKSDTILNQTRMMKKKLNITFKEQMMKKNLKVSDKLYSIHKQSLDNLEIIM